MRRCMGRSFEGTRPGERAAFNYAAAAKQRFFEDCARSMVWPTG